MAPRTRATTASSSASTTSTRKRHAAYRPPSSLSSGRTRRTSLGAAYPRHRTGSREVTGRTAPQNGKRASRAPPGNHQAPIDVEMAHFITVWPSHGAKQATAERTSSPLHTESRLARKSSPPQRVPCYGKRSSLFSPSRRNDRPPVASFTSPLRHQTKRHRRTQATACPPHEDRGHYLCSLAARGMSVAGGGAGGGGGRGAGGGGGGGLGRGEGGGGGGGGRAEVLA